MHDLCIMAEPPAVLLFGDIAESKERSGTLAEIIWHDGMGMLLYAKRLERGKFT